MTLRNRLRVSVGPDSQLPSSYKPLSRITGNIASGYRDEKRTIRRRSSDGLVEKLICCRRPLHFSFQPNRHIRRDIQIAFIEIARLCLRTSGGGASPNQVKLYNLLCS